MNALIASLQIFGFFLNCLWVIPAQSFVLLITKGPASYVLPRWWHKIACFIFGLYVHIEGKPYTDHQTLYMSNHLSYLDIPVIGSVIKASFVSKSDVARWPVFGFLSRLQQTAFIQRKRTEAGQQKNALQNRINNGHNLIIFPEGTSTSGMDVLPFKSSLFALALTDDVQDLYIQPVTLSVLEVGGHPARTKQEKNLYAWPLEMDMELHHHLWRFAKIRKGAHLKLTFHEPVKASDYTDRKVLAKTCHDIIMRGLE